MRPHRRRRWTLVLVPGIVAIVAVACGDTVVYVLPPGAGAGVDAAVGDTSELDAMSPPPDAFAPAPNDAGAADASDASVDSDTGPAPAPDGFVQCGATTCDIRSEYCCGLQDGTRFCKLLDGGGCIPNTIECDSTSECPEGEFCRLIVFGQSFTARCVGGNVGFPYVQPNDAGFAILACDPNPTPPYEVCKGGAPCIRQTCRGFVFDLCGEIPVSGRCDP